MSETFPRSPYDAVGGLAYFPRMLDKIRLHAAGQLGPLYTKHLGTDFDGRCLTFLGVKYEDVKPLVLAGKPDEEVLEWCYTHGRRPTADEIEIWSDFMKKRGWRDAASDRIIFRLKEAGLEHRDREVGTMFDFIDVDEGRTPPDFSAWQPPRFK